jgi:Ca2+-binding EF-hand superfamily protein
MKLNRILLVAATLCLVALV